MLMQMQCNYGAKLLVSAVSARFDCYLESLLWNVSVLMVYKDLIREAI
jgi:hypothetical protein